MDKLANEEDLMEDQIVLQQNQESCEKNTTLKKVGDDEDGREMTKTTTTTFEYLWELKMKVSLSLVLYFSFFSFIIYFITSLQQAEAKEIYSLLMISMLAICYPLSLFFIIYFILFYFILESK